MGVSVAFWDFLGGESGAGTVVVFNTEPRKLVSLLSLMVD